MPSRSSAGVDLPGGRARERVHELGQTFEREIFALQRNQNAVRRGQRIDREQAERWRAIDEDVIAVVAGAFEQGAFRRAFRAQIPRPIRLRPR